VWVSHEDKEAGVEPEWVYTGDTFEEVAEKAEADAFAASFEEWADYGVECTDPLGRNCIGMFARRSLQWLDDDDFIVGDFREWQEREDWPVWWPSSVVSDAMATVRDIARLQNEDDDAWSRGPASYYGAPPRL